MRTVNSVSLVGRLTKAVEIRANSKPNEKGILGGTAYFSLANVQKSIKLEDGSYKDDPRFFNCRLSVGDVNGKYAEYLKGLTTKDYVAVEGTIDYYTSSKDGKVYYQVTVEQFGALNKLTLSGNVTQDAKKKLSTREGSKPNEGFTHFTLATTLYGHKKPLYQRCSLNLRAVDKFVELKKGDRVITEGFLVTQEWEQDGQKKSENVLICNPSTTVILRKEVQNSEETEATEETAPQAPAPKKFKAIVKTPVVEEELPLEEDEPHYEDEPFDGENIPF